MGGCVAISGHPYAEAGDGNRTRVACLEGRSFTIKLLPHAAFIVWHESGLCVKRGSQLSNKPTRGSIIYAIHPP